MAQSSYTIANSSGAVFRARVNELAAAIQSANSGPTAPSAPVAGMEWFDTSVSPPVLRVRNGANDDWNIVISGEDVADIRTQLGLSTISGRNKLINGNFDVWQRGTSFSGSQYGADRWLNARAGTAATQSQQAFALGQTDVPNEPEYFARTVVSSVAGAGNYAILVQRIEGVRTFAGQTVTVSFFAKADAAKNIAVEFEQNFGTGGSPSAEVTGIGVATIALTTAFQKFTVTATMPSIAGKTLGTSGTDSFQLNFWFESGSDFNARNNSLGQQSGTFDIAQVQLEAGSVATAFERRPFGTELALCQRYFEPLIAQIAQAASGGGQAIGGRLYFSTSKRGTPTVLLLAPPSDFVNASSDTFDVVNSSGFRHFAVSSAAGGVVVTRSIAIDAEL